MRQLLGTRDGRVEQVETTQGRFAADDVLLTVPTTVAADASLIGVTIAPDASNPLTAFTLTVSWTKTATVSLASLLSNSTNPFAYLVAFSGTSGPLPVAGKVTLGGGNATTQASANIYASS